MSANLISISSVQSSAMLNVPSLGLASMALICMPWGSVSTSSLAMALLKSCMNEHDIKCKLHYFNIDFAAAIGSDDYNVLAHFGQIHTEWFFAYSLYGLPGTGELRNEWDMISCNGVGKSLINLFMERTGRSAEEAASKCRYIAEVAVPAFIQSCVDADDWGKYNAVGFTTVFAQSLASLLLAKAIKAKHPKVSIILGGPNVDGEMGFELLKGSPFVDFVVHGEAEETLPPLMWRISRGSTEHIPGVSERKSGSNDLISGASDSIPLIDMDKSPAPDYSDYISALIKHGLYSKRHLMLFFESSRGCWWGAKQHCTFCGLNGSTMAFRKKSPDRVLQELTQLSTSYDCLRFSATDNILSLDYFNTLLSSLTEVDHDYKLFYEVKANMNKNQVAALALAGITQIQPGIESLNTRILGLMNKGITAIQNIQLLKWCKELDVQPSWNILYGFPGELPSDYDDLAKTMRLLFHLRPPQVLTLIQFERYSPYFFKSEEYGLKLRPDPIYETLFPGSRMALEKIAYFFQNTAPGLIGNTQIYIRPAVETLEQWHVHQEVSKGVCTCTYQKGPGFIVIEDKRHMLSETDGFRQITLRGDTASTYIYCDQVRSEKQIRDFLHTHTKGKGNADLLFRHLEDLVKDGLMYKEGTRYLSLAIRAPRGTVSRSMQ